MQRELIYLVMTNSRRIAHSPGDAERIARLLHMQVILVCVAHAALKMWIAGRQTSGDPGEDVTMDGIPDPAIGEILACDPAYTPGIPLRTLWESVAGVGESWFSLPAGPVFFADTSPYR